MRIVGAFAAVILLVGVTALIGCYTFLPPMVERMVAGNLRQSLGLATDPDVRLTSDPPPNLLLGKFARGEIEMKGVDLGGIKPDRVTVNLAPFDVNVVESAASGAVKVREPLSGTVRVELSEEQVEKIARERVRDFPIQGVKLTEGRLTVASEVRILGFPVPVSVDGGLIVRNGALAFEPREVRAVGVPVPKKLADALLSGVDFGYRIEGLPYDTEIQDVRVKEGGLVLTGDIRGIKLGGSGG